MTLKNADLVDHIDQAFRKKEELTVHDRLLPNLNMHTDRAFITGSFAYGVPKPESDIDLVLLVECPITKYILLEAGGGVPTRFEGERKLNLIVFTNQMRYRAWKDATRILSKRYEDTGAPVSREDARDEINRQCRLRNVPKSEPMS